MPVNLLIVGPFLLNHYCNPPDLVICTRTVFGVGAEYDVSRHFSVRAEYRGLFYKMPDFGIDNGFPKQRLFTVTNTPAISLVYHFRSSSNQKQTAKSQRGPY
jgi:hypothetical protein